MNLYQAGYTRRGKQGEGSGWSIVSPSGDMSQVAKEGFSGYAGNLAELANNVNMPTEAIGVFQHDRFLYYLHINYAANAEDARGVSFTHGYCFNLNDYYTLCENPERLFGVTDAAFLMNYDPEVKEYPVVQELPYLPMNYEQVMAKYQLSTEEYRRLLIGATCAIEGYASPLCIKIDCAKDAYAQVCREIMYLIMSGLPYHLRTKVNFFSFRGGKTNVYFSDVVEGNNYFDVDTKEYCCDKTSLEKYQFTQIYNLPSDSQRQAILKSIADFMNQSFDIPLKEIDCEHVEHGFQAILKNVSGKVIDGDRTINLLTSFMNLPLKECEAVEEYLAALLDSINQNDLTVENKSMLNRVVNRAKNSVNPALRDAYLHFYARQIISGDKVESHSILWKQYQDDVMQYNLLINSIRNRDEEFFQDYYRNTFMPKRLKDMDSILSFLQECQGGFEADKQFDELLRNATKMRMNLASGFTELFEVHELAGRIAYLLENYNYEYAQTYSELADYTLWSHYEISSFNPIDIDLYKLCSIDKLLMHGERGPVFEKVRTVKNLIEVIESIDSGLDGDKVYELFFTDKLLEDNETKCLVQNIVRKNYLPIARPSTVRDFDSVLLCFYSLKKRHFDVTKYVRYVYDRGYGNLFESGDLRNLIGYSSLLSDRRIKERLAEDAELVLKNKTWKSGDSSDKLVKRGLEKLNTNLAGKVSSSFGWEDETNGLGIHKIAVGYLPIVAIAFLLFCLSKYVGYSNILIWGFGILGLLAVIAVIAAKIYHSGGLDEYLDESGLTTSSKRIGAFVLILFLVISTITMVILFWKLPTFQQSSGTKTLVGMIVAGVYVLIAAVAAILGFVREDA